MINAANLSISYICTQLYLYLFIFHTVLMTMLALCSIVHNEVLDFGVYLHEILAAALSEARHTDWCKHRGRTVVDCLKCCFHCSLTHNIHSISLSVSINWLIMYHLWPCHTASQYCTNHLHSLYYFIKM